jgi:hypothetical protein
MRTWMGRFSSDGGGSGESLPAGKFLATIPRQEVTSKKETVLDRVNQLMSF